MVLCSHGFRKRGAPDPRERPSGLGAQSTGLAPSLEQPSARSPCSLLGEASPRDVPPLRASPGPGPMHPTVDRGAGRVGSLRGTHAVQACLEARPSSGLLGGRRGDRRRDPRRRRRGAWPAGVRPAGGLWHWGARGAPGGCRVRGAPAGVPSGPSPPGTPPLTSGPPGLVGEGHELTGSPLGPRGPGPPLAPFTPGLPGAPLLP